MFTTDHVVVKVSIDFPSNSKRDDLFHCIAYDYSCADWDGNRDHFRDVPWDDIFKFNASAAASEFCKSVQVGIDVYIVIIRSSLTHFHGFQLFVLLPQLMEITFFVSTNRINLLNLEQSLDRLVIVAKGFLKLPNLHMLIKQKSITSQKFALKIFGELLIVFSTKVNLLIYVLISFYVNFI